MLKNYISTLLFRLPSLREGLGMGTKGKTILNHLSTSLYFYMEN